MPIHALTWLNRRFPMRIAIAAINSIQCRLIMFLLFFVLHMIRINIYNRRFFQRNRRIIRHRSFHTFVEFLHCVVDVCGLYQNIRISPLFFADYFVHRNKSESSGIPFIGRIFFARKYLAIMCAGNVGHCKLTGDKRRYFFDYSRFCFGKT